ncbi:MAG: DUF4097 family beta strand repeat protein [Candidatus Hydrogenedentes bacterium]|nr:DUF4097 family beta strand repeat protein [Candidatus Hydrogenedentota bacterium]
MMRVSTAALASMAVAMMAFADTAIDEVRTVGATGTVEVSNVKGRVDVAGWDRNEVRVSGTLGNNVERLEFTHEDDDTEVRVVLPKRGRVGETNLVIQIPVGNELVVDCISGSIEVRDIKADVELVTISGSVRVAGITGDVIAKSTSGSVRVENCSGDIEAKSTSGSVRLDNCKGDVEASSVSGSVRSINGSGDIQAESFSGSVEVDGDFGDVEGRSTSGSVHIKTVRETARASSVSGSIEISGVTPREIEGRSNSGSVSYTGGLAPDAKLRARTHSGSVRLNLPADVSARVHAQTFSGGINNNLGGPTAVKLEDGPGKTLDIKLGSGSASIDAQAFSGSVTLSPK